MAADYVVRPMRHEDAPAVERLTAAGSHDLDRRGMEHILRHDPGGCWVAEDRSGLVGVAAAMKRDLTWVLATFVVRSGAPDRGVGSQLLDAAQTHGRGCLRGMLAASPDPAAARRYRLAGFSLHPTMHLTGPVDRALLPVVDRVRDGSAGDIDLMDSIDRRVRDAAHGVDHQLMASTLRLVLIDRHTGSGYVYVRPGGGPYLLAATNRRTATDLLWESLAASVPDQPCAIDHVSAQNEWAVDVGLAARMELHTSGYLALQGLKPPAPYLPSGHFL